MSQEEGMQFPEMVKLLSPQQRKELGEWVFQQPVASPMELYRGGNYSRTFEIGGCQRLVCCLVEGGCNFYTARCLKNALNYWLGKVSAHLSLHIYSDEKSRRYKGTDNFVQYVPTFIGQTMFASHAEVREVKTLVSDRSVSGNDYSLVLQMVDLLLGVIMQLMTGRSKKVSKVNLGNLVGGDCG